VVLETVQVLVAFAAHLAAIRLLFLHTHSAGIRDRGCGVDDGEATVRVFLELLVLVAVL